MLKKTFSQTQGPSRTLYINILVNFVQVAGQKAYPELVIACVEYLCSYQLHVCLDDLSIVFTIPLLGQYEPGFFFVKLNRSQRMGVDPNPNV